MCPQTGFDRPHHPGFEMFNTWKTPFLIKIVLQRGENTGSTVGERKKTVREGWGQVGKLKLHRVSLYDQKY